MKNTTNQILCLLLFSQLLMAGARQLGTGGVIQIEGSSGSGLIPWATITGYSQEKEIDYNLTYTKVSLNDYKLKVQGFSLGWNNRIELSLAKQKLSAFRLAELTNNPGLAFNQDVLGLKVRLFGDIIYSKAPQISVGFQRKRNRDFQIIQTLGAVNDTGVDVYLSATKLFLSKPFGLNGFINANIRSTNANEIGFLGFGGDLNNKRRLLYELSSGIFINKKTAIGFDYRQKKSQLNAASEGDWKDVFVGYFPNKHLSLVLSYVDLGSIFNLPKQTGWYFSVTGGF